ncbi:retrovirus-related pol polyprotein from transposon TNT 1-94 [Tanacetum coccineum]
MHTLDSAIIYPMIVIISLRRGIKPRNPQHVIKSCDTRGSIVHTTTDYNDIEWFRRGEALQAKQAEALKSTKAESSNASKSKTPTKSGCSRHMTGVKSYLHKYVEQPGPKVVFGDDSTCTTEGYGSIKCNGIVLTKVAFVNGPKYNLVSISQLCDAKYIVQLDEKRGTIFNSNKEVVMIALRVKECTPGYTRKVKHLKLSCPSSKELKIKMTSKLNNSELIMNLIEAARTMLSGFVFSKQYWTEAVATACYTQNRSTIVKRHLKTPYEIFRKRIPNIDFLYVFGCPVFIHNHKDHLGKFDEKDDDGYFLGYSLISKAFKVFNTIRQQTKETYHITFDESPDAIKFTKPLVDNINIAESERYPPDEYLHPYEPSQRYQTNTNGVSFTKPYECSKPVVLETEVPSDQNGQVDQNNHNDQNDQSVQTNEILNDDQSEHSNHTNDE